ncbi:MAG: conjugal transfer protein TraX, partial [Kineothrix sp.]|nr:conjugal transfer protein TraX [Kineothrix sp.]
FTLFIGLLVLIGFRFVERKVEWNRMVRAVLHLLLLVVGMFAADLLMTDYSGMGVLTIAAMYLCRRSRWLEMGAGCAALTIMSLNEMPAFLTMIPVGMYNGKRGWNLKWIFYIFYPAHILLLYIIAYGMGVGDIMLR